MINHFFFSVINLPEGDACYDGSLFQTKWWIGLDSLKQHGLRASALLITMQNSLRYYYNILCIRQNLYNVKLVQVNLKLVFWISDMIKKFSRSQIYLFFLMLSLYWNKKFSFPLPFQSSPNLTFFDILNSTRNLFERCTAYAPRKVFAKN